MVCYSLMLIGDSANVMSIHYSLFTIHYSLNYQYLAFAVVVVAAGEDTFAGAEAFEDFVILRVLATDDDGAFFSAVGVGEDVYPLAAGVLVEAAAGDEDRLFALAQLQVEVVGLSGADVVGNGVAEEEVGLELAVANVGIDLAKAGAVVLFLPVEGGAEACGDAVDVVLVDLRLNLVAVEVVDLADGGTGVDVLPQHDVEEANLSVDGGLDAEVLLAAAYHGHIKAHIAQIVAQLLQFFAAVEAVLPLAFADHLQFVAGQLVVLLRFEVFLAGDEVLVPELLAALVGALGAAHFDLQREAFLTDGEFLLLHTDEGVAEDVFFLGQLGFGVEDLQVEVFVAQYKYNVASLDFSAFLGDYLLDDAAFGGAQLHRCHRHHGAADADVVVEVGAEDLADGEGVAADALRAAVWPHDEEEDKCCQHCRTPIGDGFSGKGPAEAFFLFYLYIHIALFRCVVISLYRYIVITLLRYLVITIFYKSFPVR